MQRRRFIGSVAALMAAAAVQPAIASQSPVSDNWFTRLKKRFTLSGDRQRLKEMMKTGLVSNQTFTFTEPITLDISYLRIENCEFIFDFDKPQDTGMIVSKSAMHMQMTNCHIRYINQPAKYGILFEYGAGGSVSGDSTLYYN
jgi:hypothetical protein